MRISRSKIIRIFTDPIMIALGIGSIIVAFGMPVAVYLFDIYRNRIHYRITRLHEDIKLLGGPDFILQLRFNFEVQKRGSEPLYLLQANFILPPDLHAKLIQLYPSLSIENELKLIEKDDNKVLYQSIPKGGQLLDENRPYVLGVHPDNFHPALHTISDSFLEVGNLFQTIGLSVERHKNHCEVLILDSDSNEYREFKLKHMKSIVNSDRVNWIVERLGG